MEILFRLSGEHPSLPRAEIFAVMEGEGIESKVLVEFDKDRILVIDAKTNSEEFLHRLALTKLAGEFVGMFHGLEEMADLVAEKIPPNSKIAVRGSLPLEKELGAMFTEKGFGIDLEKPEFSIPLFKTGKQYLAAIDIPLGRDFEKRKPQFRPYFHPTSMHPRIARALVNLARVKKGDTVLDPFCGTGGILIEAGLMGMKASGSDIDEDMVEGSMKNLKHFGLEGEIKQTDALKLAEEFTGIDAIVTDMPYGRSSFTSEKDTKKLYNQFISAAARLLEKDKYLVVVMPDKFTPESGGFSVAGEFSIYVHKSLTRKVWVMRRA
ncbi:MAG: methyltransferase domain-containing protein [Candidatus Altiarchaeota archaeon]|nr:methyltransferase domain-containing protein [Candidatus Altiarchaeota archaeon]